MPGVTSSPSLVDVRQVSSDAESLEARTRKSVIGGFQKPEGPYRAKTAREKLAAFFHRSPMSAQATVSLTWWEKWYYYGRFPWKPLIHLLIALLAAALVAIEINLGQNAKSISLQTLETLNTVLLGEEVELQLNQGSYSKDMIYSDEVIQHLNRSLTNYKDFPAKTIDIFSFTQHGNMTHPMPPPVLTVESYVHTIKTNSQGHIDGTHIKEYPLDVGNLGPFQNATTEQTQKFFHNLKTMSVRHRNFREVYTQQVNFTYYTVDIIGDNSFLQEWKMKLFYDFTDRASRITVNLIYEENDLAIRIQFISKFKVEIGLQIAIIILCVISHFLSFASLKDSFAILQKAKSNFHLWKDKQIIQWEDVPFHIKVHLINFWFAFSLVADTLLPIGCVSNLIRYAVTNPPESLSTVVSLCIGVGTMFAWFNMTRYVGILINTIGDGVPKVGERGDFVEVKQVLRVIVSVIPIMFAYTIAGVYFFSYRVDGFSGYVEAFASLFSLQNGDNVRATFTDFSVYGFMGVIYLFTYLFFGIYVFTNIFISIIADSYSSSKKIMGRNHEADLAGSEQLWNVIFNDETSVEDGNQSDREEPANSIVEIVNPPSSSDYGSMSDTTSLLRASIQDDDERAQAMMRADATLKITRKIAVIADKQRVLQKKMDKLVVKLENTVHPEEERIVGRIDYNFQTYKADTCHSTFIWLLGQVGKALPYAASMRYAASSAADKALLSYHTQLTVDLKHLEDEIDTKFDKMEDKFDKIDERLRQIERLTNQVAKFVEV
ncbi:mucolipin-3-like [Planoprotostelium fungivorum]|uniref:Mucolipin-3-like n=1 Tax=Planoprotostelium fungivorum TaxID=1890364 RepID=A0A2P6NGF5_9EUKA|nr:mucolipin-3-like [Planoprotostelium fungivorum]